MSGAEKVLKRVQKGCKKVLKGCKKGAKRVQITYVLEKHGDLFR